MIDFILGFVFGLLPIMGMFLFLGVLYYVIDEIVAERILRKARKRIGEE